MANARKYGRKLENWQSIYDDITKKYSKEGKTNEEMEIIMKEIFNKYNLYNLSYEKVEDENILNDYLKRGIKCLLTFDWNNLEWDNFSNYMTDTSIEQKDKLITLDILQKPNLDIDDPNRIGGHSVILSEIDENGNYIIINSWGEQWGNNGTCRIKKECFKQEEVYFAVYWTELLLTEDEKKSWEKLRTDTIKYLKEMKCLTCPKCKRRALIEQFEKIDRCKLKCPFEEKCIFEIWNNDDSELKFIVEQLLSYDLYKNTYAKEKFDFGFK